MPQNASAGLIAALKASLADVDAGWTVLGIAEGTGARVSTTNARVSAGVQTCGQPGGAPMNQSYVDVVGSVSTLTTVITEIFLLAAGLRSAVGSSTPLSVLYRSIWVNNAFSAGQILADGAQLQSTDAALDTAMRNKATAFLTARDTSLTQTLSAGAVTPADDPMLLPEDLKAAIKASLGDPDAGWKARLRSEHQPMSPESAVASRITISLSSPIDGGPYVRLIPGSRAPASFSYEATLGSSGQLIDASLRIDSAVWRTGLDGELHSAIMALGDAFVDHQRSSLTGAIGSGPQ